MAAEEIKNYINLLFSPKDIPDAKDLVLGSSGEAIEIKNAFINKTWSEIPKSELIYYNSALSFLSNAGFRYYLPAYMMLLLENVVEPDILSDDVISHLTLPLEIDNLRLINVMVKTNYHNQFIKDFLLQQLASSTQLANYFIRRMNYFSLDQGKCINAFLLRLYQLYPDYYDGKEPVIASQRYWFKYDL